MNNLYLYLILIKQYVESYEYMELHFQRGTFLGWKKF